MTPRDLNTLGYYEWREGLLRGIAAHHAGMLPLFKETVETLFATGLIKLVFATETLALGINMPARTVILEKLTKYNGETPRRYHPPANTPSSPDAQAGAASTLKATPSSPGAPTPPQRTSHPSPPPVPTR